MEPVHLSADEIDYELQIRNKVSGANIREKTKLLAEILKREEKGYDVSPTGLLETATAETELQICKEKICNIKVNLASVGWKPSKTKIKHVQDRLNRLMDMPLSSSLEFELESLTNFVNETARLGELSEIKKGAQISIPGSERSKETNLVQIDQIQGEFNSDQPLPFSIASTNQKSDIPKTLPIFDNEQSLVNSLQPPIQPQIHSNNDCTSRNSNQNLNKSNEEDEELATALGSSLLSLLQAQQKQLHHNQPRPSPVSHWKFTYSGEAGNLKLSEFLSKVEMHAKADHLSDTDLVDSAVFLFEGEVARWWQSARNNYSSWKQVALALKSGFSAPEDDLQIQRKILDRRQTQNEPFCVYIADMENLFSNLTFTLSEQQKLTFLKGNMLPFYIEHLALTPVNSVRELIIFCGLLEKTRQRLQQLQPPTVAAPLVATAVESQQTQNVQNEISEISQQNNTLNARSQISGNTDNRNSHRASNQNRGPRGNNNFYSNFRPRRDGNGNFWNSRTFSRSNFYDNSSRNFQNTRDRQNFGNVNSRRDYGNRPRQNRGQENNRNESSRNFNNTPCRNCGYYGHSAAICFPAPANRERPRNDQENSGNSQQNGPQTIQDTPRPTNPFL